MIEINNQSRSKIDERLIRKTAENFLKKYKKSDFDLSIAIIGDERMRKLNNSYRKKNKPTDVLSFEGDKRDKFLGEIVIDYAQIKRQAPKMKNTPKKELEFILVHGLFHLLGYDDATDKGAEKMDKLARDFLKIK